ncbi:MAG: PD40 domain-containing protein [Deltaproteobacteria bacterium]|nr:PD40 domain-containing protein [Deltaproteobacteria bacterium]
MAFMSSANNLIPNDVLDTSKDIFVHDMLTGVTTLVSKDSSGNKAASECNYPSISADGRYIAFSSYAFLATNDNNDNMDIYVRDIQLGTTTLVSNTLEGWAGSGKSCVMSSNGQYVAFSSFDPYIVLNDNNGLSDIFIKDWEMGAIKMTIAPSYLIPSTTQSWCLDDKDWYNENQLVTGVTVGHHFIRFKSVTDWIQPQILHIDIPAGEITYLTGTYHQEGSLNVTIFPGAAVNAGALWTLDGVNWYPSDTTLHNLLVGQYTITYKSLDLWNTPASQTVTVKNKPVACASATYTPKPGSVKVTLSPQAAIDAGARWRLDGGAWQQSGDTVNNIPIGQHTVSYLSPNGYNTVPNCVVNIYSCQTATASAKYILSPSLKVLISPQAAINAGAKWRVDSSPWQSSGASLTDLAPGPHSITFNTVANWTPPCRQIIYLTEGQPSTTTGIYTVPSTIRALRVTIEPQAAAAAGARWRVDSSPWQTSGTTLTGLSVGQHTVKFNIIPGWVTPLNKTVAISSGTTACTTGVYAAIQPPGALNVTALPQAVIGKAYWRVFDGAFETPWRAAGTGPINVPAGEHTVFFSDLAGFVTPASQTVTVIAGQTLNLTGTYTIAATTTGTLTVSLARPMAMGAQARWRVYDGPSGYSSNWLYMGARLLKVPTGQHTVVFKPVPGWVTPSDQTVTITVGQDTKATATYTR